MDWNTAIAVEPLGGGSFRAHVDEHWRSLQGVHGGIVAALAVRASESVVAGLGADPSTSLRSATFGYVRGNVIGHSDWPINPAGFTFHGKIHETVEGADCVMHVHTTPVMAVFCRVPPTNHA